MKPEHSDNELMIRLQSGEREALKELHIRHSEKLYYFFYRACFKDTEEAKDLLQDLFLKIFQKASLYNAKRDFLPWAYSIAHNMLKNEFAKKEVRTRYQSTHNNSDAADHPEGDIELHDECEMIYSCLEQFEASKRTAFILRFREDMSIKEISKTLNIPEGTIKSGLHYTIKKVKEKLADYGKNR